MVGIVLIWGGDVRHPALKFNKFYIVILFGGDWLDDYDSMKEYERKLH